MFSGISSLIWGAAPAASEGDAVPPPSNTKKPPSPKKSLKEENISVGLDDEWVLINDQGLQGSKKGSGKKKTRTESTSSTTSTGSGSPRAKKSRTKEETAVVGGVHLNLSDNHVPIVVKKLNQSNKAGRKTTKFQKDLEGEKLLAEMEEEEGMASSSEFPTIQEASGRRKNSTSVDGTTLVDGIKEKSPSPTLSYAAVIAKKAASSEGAKTPPPSPPASTAPPEAPTEGRARGVARERNTPAQSSLPSTSPSPIKSSSSETSSTSSSGSSSSSEDKVAESPAILPVNNRKKSSKKGMKGEQGTMEGSWFLTPPPCFTQPNTFALISSPIEDFLIEKPPVFERSTSVPSSAKSNRKKPETPMTDSQLRAVLPFADADIDEEENIPPTMDRKSPVIIGGDLKKSMAVNEEQDEDNFPLPSHHQSRVVSSVNNHLRGGSSPSPVALSEMQLPNKLMTIFPRRLKGGRVGRRNRRGKKEKENKESKEPLEETSPPVVSSSHAALLSDVRSRAYEPIKQESARLKAVNYVTSRRGDKVSNLIYGGPGAGGHRPSRKDKYAARPHTYSTNRKTHKNFN